ncbi:hypothetical protein BaRGS_00038092 [Batillaria attramentaria]|uniref:Uncharacterized protein n=1 Tax=Batillaria attramentaria TaxID=370345 RepID=A0ABD0J784_9CAEN
MTVSFFSVSVYHKEQAKRKLVCSKCLEEGHHVSGCTNKVMCRACRESGHKRGDPACEFATRTDIISPVLQQTEAGSERPDVEGGGQGRWRRLMRLSKIQL